MRLEIRFMMTAALCMGALLQACATTEVPQLAGKSGTHSPSAEQVRSALRAVPAYDHLETFLSRAEFDYYVRKVREVNRRFGLAWYAPEPCNPSISSCEEELQEVAVTGTRVSGATKSGVASITNNQASGVDEGDIVKAWGRFLIVLHDARLFSVDLGSSPRNLRLADRVDAYQNSNTDAWYDELLIQDNHVLVTGYSYDAGQTELSVFEIGQDGRLSLQSRFFIKSDDYYSGGNYSSRLVGGNLVLYTPIDLETRSQPQPVGFPQWRRWSLGQGFTPWKPLLLPADIYKPMDPVLDPVVHVISVCPVLPGKAGQCESRGVIASYDRVLYVTPDAAFLWNTPENVGNHQWSALEECRDEASTINSKSRKATVFRLSFDDQNITALRAHGRPPDQFALESHSNRFYALVRRIPDECRKYGTLPLELLTFSLRDFSDLPAPMLASHVRALPVPDDGGIISARYSADYLSYGVGSAWGRARYGNEAQPAQFSFVTVPLRRPDRFLQHALSHSTERVELLGENVIAIGAGVDQALGATALDLRRTPEVAGSVRISDARESEGRSHAFNARVQVDGSAVLGLPIEVGIGKKSDGTSRFGYEDTEERLQFFTTDQDLTLRTAGTLAGNLLPGNPSYMCEVSCVDWYGNTRPIFYRDRVFALMGREFVEAELQDERVREVARLDLTGDFGSQSPSGR